MQTNQKKKKKLENNSDSLKSWAKYSGLAFQMAFVIALGVWGGQKLDQYFETREPVFSIIIIFIAVCASIYLAIKDFINPKE